MKGRNNIFSSLLYGMAALLFLSASAIAKETTLATVQRVLSSHLDTLSQEEATKVFLAEQESFQRDQSRRKLKVSDKTGYLICHKDASKSGAERLEDIKSSISSKRFQVVKNKKDETCVIFRLKLNEADSLASSNIVIVPLTKSTKARKNSNKIINEFGPDEEKSIGAVLCPGISETIEEVETVAIEAVTDFKATASNNCVTILDASSIFAASSDVAIFHFRKGDVNAQGQLKKCITDLLDYLLESDTMCSVEAYRPFLSSNEIAQWITQSGVENSRPWFDVGLEGSGQVVSVSDTGLDTDNCYFVDPNTALVKDGTVQLSQRKVVQYEDFMDASDVENGHGTHVVGTIVGRKLEGGIEVAGSGDGVARKAKVAFFDVGEGSDCCYIPSVAKLFGPGQSAGAKIASASWGAQTDLSYTGWVRSFDQYLHENPDFLFITSAGNQGDSGSKTITSPAQGKNVFAVGSSQSEGAGLSGKDTLSNFSSRGPTDDGRTKPDIVAPGESLQSAGANPSVQGECDETLLYKSGTSMAAPVVAGSAALVREYFMSGYYPTGESVVANAYTPSAALIKAVLLNGAQPLSTTQSGDVLAAYDNNQNFGRVSLIDSLPLLGKNDIKASIDENTVSAGATETYSITIGQCSATEMSATLVWTDPEATAGCTSCLVNNLDLAVIKGGNTYYPNGLSAADEINSSERVRLTVSPGDVLTVTVTATNMITSSQSYALVITGCLSGLDEKLTPAPVTNAPVGNPTPAPTPAPTAKFQEADDLTDWVLLPGKPSTTMSAAAAVAIVPFIITVGRDTQTSIYKSDCTTPVPTNVATVTEGVKKAHTALSQEFDATVNFDLNNLPGSGMYTDLPESEGGKIDVCIRVDLMLNAASNGIDLDGNGALDEGNISVAFKEFKLSILFSWLEDFSTPTPIDTVVKVLTEEDIQSETAAIDMDLQVCHCDETKQCVTEGVSQNSYLDVCISFGSNAYDDAIFEELTEFTVAQGDVSVAAVAATVPNSLTTKDIAAKMIVVKTRLISTFFLSGIGEINVSGSVRVQFSSGTTARRLLNIGHSARALETTEQTFELNLKLEESENESSGCRGGVGISIVSMLFASFIAITFVMMV